MAERIVVINPNSTEAVTAGMRAALAPLGLAGGPAIECVTLAEGPPGIESQADADAVVEPICRWIEDDPGAGAFVIGCFSDPGLAEARAGTRRPVLGIGESSVATALTRAERFGVIAILEDSAARQRARFAAMGLGARFAESLPIGLGIARLADDAKTLARMIEAGEGLRDDHGAGVVIMGCAGMARFQEPLARALGIGVIEPVRAGTVLAIGALLAP